MRTLAETERELELIQKRRDCFDRIKKGGMSRQEEELQVELLYRIGEELLALEQKHTPPPPPPPPTLFDVGALTREQAAAKAAEIRRNPAFFRGPGYVDQNGRRFSGADWQMLRDTADACMARATGGDAGEGGAGAGAAGGDPGAGA